jgi:hypothetical protein
MDFALWCLIFTSGLSMGIAIGILINAIKSIGEPELPDT